MMTLILGLLGLSGVGFIALLFLAPAAAAVISQFVLALAKTRIGIAAIALLAGVIVGDVHRRNVDSEANKEAALRAAQRDLGIAKLAEQFAKKSLGDLQVKFSGLEKQYEDFKKSPHQSCPLGADRSKRLRRIAPP